MSFAQLDKRWSVEREVTDSNPGRTNTQDLKLTDENVLAFSCHV